MTAKAEERLEAEFHCADGTVTRSKLPAPKKEGAALRVLRDGDNWQVKVTLSQDLQPGDVGLTLMHEGNLCRFQPMEAHENVFVLNAEDLKPGVNQLTVFNATGAVLADRLFFVTSSQLTSPTLVVRTEKDSFDPYERIDLTIENSRTDTPLSVAVRDGGEEEPLYDNGNILTEMLLSSEVKGFIPHPEWYFEKDDEAHRLALDLLMMTQGWRRFAWQDMAVKGKWELCQPVEKAPILTGEVYDFDVKAIKEYALYLDEEDSPKNIWSPKEPSANASEKERKADKENAWLKEKGKKDIGSNAENWRKPKQEYAMRTNLKREVKVHAELVYPNGLEIIAGEAPTQKGLFRIQLPRFYGESILFISAADTTKWRKGEKYTWIQTQPNEDDLPESKKWKYRVMTSDYFVRMSFPYPNFIKPYNYYQCNLPPDKDTDSAHWEKREDSIMVMPEVVVKKRRARGLRELDESQPSILVDAGEARNRKYDSGMVFAPLARIFVGDYGQDAPYVGSITDGSDIDFQLYEWYGMDKIEREALGLNVPPDSVYHPKYLR